MSKFDSIRPFYDSEANAAILKIIDDPMLEAMMNFTFPHDNPAHWKDLMRHTFTAGFPDQLHLPRIDESARKKL
jgi:hypothetical protein